MKRLLFVSMLVTAVSLNVGAADQTTTEPAAPVAQTNGVPKIQFDKTIYDFGTTSLVQQLSGTFIISNVGNALLTISKPTTSCGCTVAALKTDKLAPGATTELAFTMQVGNIPRGHAEKVITVPSNDTNQPSTKLFVKAEIVPVFEYNPQNLEAGNLHTGATTNLVIQIKRTDGKSLGIGAVESKAAFIHPQIVPVAGSSNEVTLNVEVVADATVRRFNELINVLSEAGGRQLFAISVGGRIVGDLVIQPQQLVWGIPDPDNFPGPQGPAAATRNVLVGPGALDQKLVLSNLTCSVTDLKVTIAPSEDARSFKITAVIDKVPKETITGTIRFETNLQRQPVVEIPVTINVFRQK